MLSCEAFRPQASITPTLMTVIGMGLKDPFSPCRCAALQTSEAENGHDLPWFRSNMFQQANRKLDTGQLVRKHCEIFFFSPVPTLCIMASSTLCWLETVAICCSGFLQLPTVSVLRTISRAGMGWHGLAWAGMGWHGLALTVTYAIVAPSWISKFARWTLKGFGLAD